MRRRRSHRPRSRARENTRGIETPRARIGGAPITRAPAEYNAPPPAMSGTWHTTDARPQTAGEERERGPTRSRVQRRDEPRGALSQKICTPIPARAQRPDHAEQRGRCARRPDHRDRRVGRGIYHQDHRLVEPRGEVARGSNGPGASTRLPHYIAVTPTGVWCEPTSGAGRVWATARGGPSKENANARDSCDTHRTSGIHLPRGSTVTAGFDPFSVIDIR